jgi:hypothetical protein
MGRLMRSDLDALQAEGRRRGLPLSLMVAVAWRCFRDAPPSTQRAAVMRVLADRTEQDTSAAGIPATGSWDDETATPPDLAEPEGQ